MFPYNTFSTYFELTNWGTNPPYKESYKNNNNAPLLENSLLNIMIALSRPFTSQDLISNSFFYLTEFFRE